MLLLVFMFYEKYTTGANQPLPRATDYFTLNTIKYRETDETRGDEATRVLGLFKIGFINMYV